MNVADDAVDNFLAAMKRDSADDFIAGVAEANNLFASLGDLNLDDMDLGDLLATANSLSSLLRGLMGDPNMSKDMARKLGGDPNDFSDTAKAARALDDVLSRIERRDPTYPRPIIPSPQMPIDVKVVNQPDTAFKKFDLKKATKVEDIISGVAYEIHEKAKQLSGEADSVALALARLGDAARSGNKVEMLKASKEAAVHLAALAKKFQELANQIPGNTPQERKMKAELLKSAAGIRDLATQLKILCSVKAASIETNKDNDGAISTVARNLGTMMLSGLDAMAISKLSMRVK